MTSVDPSADGNRRAALALAGLLLAAGVLVALVPLLPVVRTADGAAVTAFPVAGWVAVLPGVLAVALALVRPVLGLAATAGAGLIGIARMLADLAVLTETDRVTRPELFVETTDRARPFGTGAGGWVLLAADGLMVVVGVVAARRLARQVLIRDGPDEVIFGSPSPMTPPATPDGQAAAAVLAMTGEPSTRRRLNLPMVGVGLLGSVLLLVGNLDVPYTGGYLALRVLPFGSSVTGLASAVLLAGSCAGVVLVAAALPRDVAQSLLAGTALAAAVPLLTAVVAVVLAAPTGLSGTVWWGLAGALMVAASGLLARRGPPRTGPADAVATPRTPTLIAAGLGLASAASLAGASQAALLYLDGAAPDEVTGVLLAPAALPLLIAAGPLAVAGVLALVPGTAAAGRAGLMVVWAGAAYALGRAFWATSLVSATSTGSTTGVTHSWTVGPGGALMSLGAALAVAAAMLALVGHRRAGEASTEIVDDETLTRSREVRRWPAITATAVVLVALAFPVYGGIGVSSAPSLLHGLDLDTWAFWALAVGVELGIWSGAVSRWPQVAAAGPVAAAVVLAQPLVVPDAVRALPGFTLATGFWIIVGVAVGLVALGAMFARSAAGIATRTPWPKDGSERPAAVDLKSKGGRA